jgi:prophage regulatory protein
MKMLSIGELKTEKGIKFSRQHIHKLVSAGKFPRPIKIGENTNAWPEHEIDAYLKDRIRERDAQQTEAA